MCHNCDREAPGFWKGFFDEERQIVHAEVQKRYQRDALKELAAAQQAQADAEHKLQLAAIRRQTAEANQAAARAQLLRIALEETAPPPPPVSHPSISRSPRLQLPSWTR